MRKFWHLLSFLCFFLYPFNSQADIAFISDRDGKTDIYVMNDHGGNIRRITDTPYAQADVTWSPDGSQIAFTTELRSGRPGEPQHVEIFIINADGTGAFNLTNQPAIDADPSWSPDGKFIAFASGLHDGLNIWTIEIATRRVRKLTNSDTSSINPHWSPNGKYIVFERVLFGNGQHIYFMRADGTGEQQLLRKLRTPQFGDTLIYSLDPQWSPDSEYVLYKEVEFRTTVGVRANRVIVVDRDGRSPKVLDIPTNWKIDSACWSDDGESVLFSGIPDGFRNDTDIYDIYKYRLRDGLISNITANVYDNWAMDWTPHRGLSVSVGAKLTSQWARLKQSVSELNWTVR